MCVYLKQVLIDLALFYMCYLVANHRLVGRSISVSVWLSSINDLAHLLLFLRGQLNIPRCPVLLQASGLGSSWDSNHSLGSNPSECDLADFAALASSDSLDCLHNFLVLVEVLALEFGS